MQTPALPVGGPRVRRAAQTHLLALMPSLRVAKPSATSDSAMFSPLVSEKEKRDMSLGSKSIPKSKALLLGPLPPSALQGMMLPLAGQGGRLGWVLQKNLFSLKMSHL